MSIITWRGDAVAVAQVNTLTVGGTILATDLFILTISNKILTVVAGSTVAATVAANIVAAWNTISSAMAPELAEATALATTGGAFTITADTAGKPFVVSVSTTLAAGGASSGTFTSSITTTSAGPADASVAANYTGGVLPTTGDTLVFENSNNPVLYNLDALSAVTLAMLSVKASYTGSIGLPRTNGSGSNSYLEYRLQYLQVAATIWSIGLGDGSGSGRIKLDLGSIQFTGNVYNSGSQAENGIPAVLLKGTHASNALIVLKGTVGVAFFAGEVSTLDSLDMGYVNNIPSDSIVQCGVGVTLTTITKAGGQLTLNNNATTITQYDGQTTIIGTATLDTGVIGGTLVDQSSGLFSNITLLNRGTYDHSKSMTAKTITNFTMESASTYNDPYGMTTLSNGLFLDACRPGDVTINVPPNRTLSNVGRVGIGLWVE
jgi:hypothetical protein